MSTRRPVLATLLATLGLGVTLAAGAEQHPNHAQGFQPEHVYELGDLDSINLFNGNLTVQIPLGISYPAGGDLSYQLTLSYSGNVWDYELTQDIDGYDKLVAWPRSASNAGMGWLVSLGALDPVDGYLSPDGADHPLTAQLHAGSPTATGITYTTDGTYLRLNSNVSPKVLEFPDGTRKSFDSSGRLTRIDDRATNPNYLKVTYLASATYSGLEDWKLVDSWGRTHWVYFKPAPALSSIYPAGVVDRVVVTAFDGSPATYTFEYQTPTITRGDTDPAVSCQIASTDLAVPMLSGLMLPDGSRYAFSYDNGSYHTACSDSPYSPPRQTDSRAGHMTRMTLPTQGAVEWTWGKYLFPQYSEHVKHSIAPSTGWTDPFRQSIGVTQKRWVSSGGTNTWTYTHGLTDSKEGTTTVVDPANDKTVSYFSVYACQPQFTQTCPSQDPETTAGWSYREYGLPLTRYTKDGTGNRYQSSKAFEGASALRRTQYVRYENSGSGDKNPRVASARTLFSDDASRYIDADSSGFDGLGHYRTVVSSDNFPGTVQRTVVTNYNPGKSTTNLPSSTDPWVLETYDAVTVTEGSSVAKTEACFETATGKLLRTRALETGATRGNDDVVVRYTRHGRGHVTAEETFGGDNSNLDTTATSLCNISLPAYDTRTDYTYQYGVMKTAQSTGAPFKSLDRDIDFDTGLVQTDRDVSGLATSYEYDDLGRIAYVKPNQDGWTQYVYNVPSAGTPTAKVWIYQKPNGGGTALASQEVHFDPFGRVEIERRTMADGSTSDRKTIYNVTGRVQNRSEWGSTSSKTQYSYDAFGRTTQIVPPDGAAHTISIDYTGIRQVVRTVPIGTAWNGSAVTETNASTTETYDRDGRLYQVFEPANPDGSNSTTTYAYDVGGHLKTVTQTAKKAATASTQTRTFTYDGRGFLTSEKHPEKGSAGNGTVTYTDYDAAGRPGRVMDGPNDLTYTYDVAGRVTRIRETGSGFSSCPTSWTSGPKCVKEFTYATSNAAGDQRLGKLQVSKRYNYPVLGTTTYTAIVSQTMTYGGKQGRVSARETSLTFGGATTERFNQTWTWNDLGEVASLGYPQCNFATYCTATQPRTVTSTYTNGFRTAVPGYATAISYHPNGQINQVTRGNGVIDTYTKDPYNQARPNKIDAKYGSTVLWSTGVYGYDGAGDVTKTGSAYYLYDLVGRVVSGIVYTGAGGGATGPKPFNHTYDGFGNLQSINTATHRTTDTSPTTNRLTGAVTYDAAGNLTAWNGNAYQYDRLNQMTRMAAASGTETWLSMYDADDQRVWSFKENASPRFDRWTLRDLGGQVLRTYEATNYVWSWKEDHVYRGDTLIASVTSTGTTHLHTDHLGTVRAATNASGTRTAFHTYYPFGEEATAVNQDTQRMKFTGHERDLGDPTSAADDLDYMHARFYNGQVGRFLSTDPGASAILALPQTWNLYTYSTGNPVNRIDPDGENPLVIGGLVALGVGLGLLFGAEPANTPTSVDDQMVQGSDGMRAVAAASTVISVAKAAMEALGIFDERPKDVTIDGTRHPESAKHARDAQEAGHPETLTIDREGARARRRDALHGTKPEPGKDRDEYPPAMFKEGGDGASVRPITPSDNRGAGACLGAQCKDLPDGTRVRVKTKQRPPT